MRRHLFLLALPLFLCPGCAELQSVIDSVPADTPLSENEVADGLREALVVGSRQASSRLGSTDGYFGDAAVKILLPEEASVILDNLSKIPGGAQMVEDLVLRINRAAEDAASEAAPVFVNSIKQMTIEDAFGILKGSDDAATRYLIRTTREELYRLYRPRISRSLEKDLVGSISASDAWTTLTGTWNSFAGSVAGRMAGAETVETDLDHHLTQRALDGMFLKIKEEEKKIRHEASARVTPLLRKVFG